MVAGVLEVADLDRSLSLYRDAFGLDLHVTDHEGAGQGADDRWISGRHAAVSWTEGEFIHLALYEAKSGATTRAQVSFRVPDIATAHDRAVAAGADMLHEPRVEPWRTSARYQDYDGNVVELTQPA